MRAIVRNDIINLDSYVAAKFKYEKYIDMIHEIGGYCFIDQFEKHIGSDGRYLINQLIENGFIKTKAYSNFKYCYLTEMSIKYLKYKDINKDFDNVTKDKLTSKKITKNPSDKVLFSSAIKFALYQDNYIFGKSNYENYLREYFNSIFNKEGIDLVKYEDELIMLKKIKEDKFIENKRIFDIHLSPIYKMLPDNLNIIKSEIENQTENMKAQLRTFENKYKSMTNQIEVLKNDFIEIEKNIDAAVKKGLDYFDKSKIIFIPKKSFLEMFILDTGSVKQAMSYMPLINEFIKVGSLDNIKVKIIIVSFSKLRAESLKKEFDILLEKKNEAQEKINEYKLFKKSSSNKYEPDFVKRSNYLLDNIPDIEIFLDTSAYYIEPYKNCIGFNTNYIKNNDKERFEELKNSLKEKGNKDEKEN